MEIEKAKEIIKIISEIEETEYNLKTVDNHSFWFWTKYIDIDDYLKPIIKQFLENKIYKLKEKLNKM